VILQKANPIITYFVSWTLDPALSLSFKKQATETESNAGVNKRKKAILYINTRLLLSVFSLCRILVLTLRTVPFYYNLCDT